LGLLCWALPAAAEPPVDAAGVDGDGGRDALLSIGVRAEASPVRKDLAGFVGLTVPFERLAAPRGAAPRGPVEPLPSSAPSAPPPALERAEERDAAATTEPLAPVALAALARGALAAARRVELAPLRERALDGLASRARLSALLPEVRFRVARTRDESLRLTPTTDDPYRFTLAGGNALVLEGGATFRLSRLVFADEELAVERLRIERERAAERRTARVLDRVLAWHAALVRLAAPGDDAERTRDRLELDAAVVELDVLTDGWFGARPETRAVRWALPPSGTPAPPPAPAPPASERERRGPAPATCLDALRLSARPSEPCLPMHETASPTFSGASMR
jgi:hypothetical protein